MFSIIIITYNRPIDTFDTIENILSLDLYDNLVEEVIVVNNCSTVDYSSFVLKIEKLRDNKIKYYVSPENLGVAGGRNFGVEKSNGDILLFIDDDAVFENKDVLNIMVENYKSKNCGILAFKSKDFTTKKLNRNEFPHRNDEYLCREKFSTYFFVGVGHAIRRDIFLRVGGYPDDFFYGMEEYDLSYKAIDAGFDIIYDSNIVVLHKKVIDGRQATDLILRKYSINKIKVAYRNLPLCYLLSHVFLWIVKYLIHSKFNFIGVKRIILECYQGIKYYDRKVISRKAQSKIVHLGGTLYY